MILVDSSVWVRAFYGREPYRAQLDRILAQKQVVGHQLVYGELFIGDRGGRAEALRDYSLFTFGPLIPHEEVVFLAHSHRLQGRGLSWIDVHLLASALAGRHQLWTADARLAEVAHELSVAWNPLPSKHGVQHR